MTIMNIEIKGGELTPEQVDKVIAGINESLKDGQKVIIPSKSWFSRFVDWVYS